MAVHKLGSLNFEDLLFDPQLWELEDSTVPRIGSIVYDFYPEINRVTSLSENKAFTWLYGKIRVTGRGEVQVKYPYLDSSRDILTLRNVSFSSFPFVTIQVEPEEGWEFEGWYDICRNSLLSRNAVETLSETKWLEVTSIEARFVEI